MTRQGDFSIQVKPDIGSTFIKYSPEFQASEIEDQSLKIEIKYPQKLEIKWFQGISNHYLFELEEPINGRYNWYAFEQHVDVIDDTTNKPLEDEDIDAPEELSPPETAAAIINLEVPYFSQRDNTIRPGQTCNMTCSAMVTEFFHPGTDTNNSQLEDKMTQWCVNQWGHDAIYYHDKIVKTLANWNVKSTFGTNTSFNKIKEHLGSGKPVIYSGKFTRSGHIIVLKGYDDTGFWVNDPWGEWFSSGYQNKSGKNLHYSYRMMSRLSYSGEGSGWAHLCEKMG